jgi:hypothetical protein
MRELAEIGAIFYSYLIAGVNKESHSIDTPILSHKVGKRPYVRSHQAQQVDGAMPLFVREILRINDI